MIPGRREVDVGGGGGGAPLPKQQLDHSLECSITVLGVQMLA